jgi:hypothetical protein
MDKSAPITNFRSGSSARRLDDLQRGEFREALRGEFGSDVRLLGGAERNAVAARFVGWVSLRSTHPTATAIAACHHA